MNMKGIALLALLVLVVLYASYRYVTNDQLQGGTVIDQPAEN